MGNTILMRLGIGWYASCTVGDLDTLYGTTTHLTISKVECGIYMYHFSKYRVDKNRPNMIN